MNFKKSKHFIFKSFKSNNEEDKEDIDDDSRKKIFGLKRNNLQKKIKFKVISNNLKTGRWEDSEHQKFLEACLKYGNNWRKVQFFLKKGPRVY